MEHLILPQGKDEHSNHVASCTDRHTERFSSGISSSPGRNYENNEDQDSLGEAMLGSTPPVLIWKLLK